jgi:hypothetical protein
MIPGTWALVCFKRAGGIEKVVVVFEQLRVGACLNASMFKQPVWWTEGWAWQSFIPWHHPFSSHPFELLCAMPHVEEVKFSFLAPSGETQTEICFRMPEDDIRAWLIEDEHIVKLTHIIKL